MAEMDKVMAQLQATLTMMDDIELRLKQRGQVKTPSFDLEASDRRRRESQEKHRRLMAEFDRLMAELKKKLGTHNSGKS